jgi:hypothetical protein
MLGGLATDERRARLTAPARDARHDVRDAARNDLAARDVIGHEERCRPDDHDVVDDHSHEVDSDGVVLVDGLGDRHFRADAVRGRRQQRALEGLEERHVEEPGEPADAAHDPRSVGRGDRGFHELDGQVTGRRVDARLGVLAGHSLSVRKA